MRQKTGQSLSYSHNAQRSQQSTVPMTFYRLMIFMTTLLVSSMARSEFVLDIIGGSDNATPIAVVPFGGPTLDDNPGNIINNDLHNSGVFNTINRSTFPAQPSSSAGVFFHDWQHVGGDYLVVGNTTLNTTLGLYATHYELLSISGQQRILGETLTYSATQWRDASHQIADHIYQKITGVRGAFATRILYIDRIWNPTHGMHYRLMVADSDGHRAQAIVDSAQPLMSPAWSPDAQKVAYVSFESGHSVVYVQDIYDRKRWKVADFPGINSAPSWSPSGKSLALTLSRSGNAEIYLINLLDMSQTQLTDDPSINTEPCWYPDGKKLAFTSDRSGHPQIYQLDIATHQVMRLSFDGNYNARCAISPDGKKIAMVHREHGQIFQIAVQDLASGSMAVVTQSELVDSPSFAPNGTMLAYSTRSNNQDMLALVSPDGNIKVLLPEQGGEMSEPSWSPFLH